MKKTTLSLLLFALIIACKQEKPRPEAEAPTRQTGTAAMIKLVEAANSQIDYQKVPYFFNGARGDYYAQLAETSTDPQQQLYNSLLAGYEWLNAGQNERAITELEKLVPQVASLKPANPELVYNTKRLLALSYFRLGETANCLDRPRSESCIFPISQQGIYTITNSTERAIQLFEEILAERPDNYEAIWMTNLGYMVLGRYPQEVPAKFLLPEKLFTSKVDFPRFPDVANEAGLGSVGLSGGTAVEDFNNDGHLDIIASSWGVNDQIRFYASLGNGKFEEKTQQAGLTGVTGGLNLTHADFDNDGWMDFLILRGA